MVDYKQLSQEGEMMQIEIQLNDEYARKLSYIQEHEELGVLEAIASAIEFRYQQLQQENKDPLAKLKESPFIGCFQAEPDLAANSEDILRLMGQDKDDYSWYGFLYCTW